MRLGKIWYKYFKRYQEYTPFSHSVAFLGQSLCAIRAHNMISMTH